MSYLDNGESEREHFEHEHDWLCARCFTTISAERPPVLNRDNFCSQEASRRASDSDSAPVQVGFLNNGIAQDPLSYPTSTDGSVENPNGPVAKDPGNRFLPVVPAIGLGEPQHRLRASSDEDDERRALYICQWRNDLPLQDRTFHGSTIDAGDSGWLRQNTHIVGHMDSVRATRGGSGSSRTVLSSRSSGTSSGWSSFGINPIHEAGAWMKGWPEQPEDDAMYDDDDVMYDDDDENKI